MSLHDILPFLIGFIIQGEPALFIWLLYFINQPVNWIWICSIAVILSNLSFLTFYFIGYFANKSFTLQKFIKRLTAKLPKKNLKLPQPLLLLFLRFLFGIRNPIAIIFGLRKYDIKKFVLYNFLGSILWISTWFCMFYIIRTGIQKVITEYREVLYSLYIVFLVLWILGILIYNYKKRLT
jgi:membrane-associated protein